MHSGFAINLQVLWPIVSLAFSFFALVQLGTFKSVVIRNSPPQKFRHFHMNRQRCSFELKYFVARRSRTPNYMNISLCSLMELYICRWLEYHMYLHICMCSGTIRHLLPFLLGMISQRTPTQNNRHRIHIISHLIHYAEFPKCHTFTIDLRCVDTTLWIYSFNFENRFLTF